ncbi:hypothetical protein CK203_065141 [Vitis vinifera]|uniref:Uncharacterized protein n=1 Tax=Vitis vinifera TaxID=29760 RepID=A0A438G4S8_VITVI|nr:hypothetical protein CK203_065141 [Vitis vinifera]
MASESEASGASSSASFLERLISSRNRDLSMFIPFILGFTDTTTRQESDDPDDETTDTPTPRDRIILINPFTQGMIVIEGNSSFDSLLRELASKGGQPRPPRPRLKPCRRWRHKMPVDEEDLGKKREGSVGDEEGRGRRRVEREIWVSFSFNSNSRRNDSNQTPSTASHNDSSSSPTPDDHVMEN